jgi:hypothetical protein
MGGTERGGVVMVGSPWEVNVEEQLALHEDPQINAKALTELALTTWGPEDIWLHLTRCELTLPDKTVVVHEVRNLGGELGAEEARGGGCLFPRHFGSAPSMIVDGQYSQSWFAREQEGAVSSGDFEVLDGRLVGGTRVSE